MYSMFFSLNYEARHIINKFDYHKYLDFPSFEDGLRAHEVEWHQIEIHQIDVAAVGTIGGDLKILQRQNRFYKTILHIIKKCKF